HATNPIAVARVSGLAQSGFNEVAHGAMTPAFRRATSQKPPDSHGGNFLIHRSKHEESCDGGSDWDSIRFHAGGFTAIFSEL
ncbi:hypothetical protein KRZ98_23070, partial [Sphingobium sp. AS12]|uniref:hypothetical protein n=1 Tax=Sphingobium sp. AS12 TaxID=2849495 RepID=UPI001C31B2D7